MADPKAILVIGAGDVSARINNTGARAHLTAHLLGVASHDDYEVAGVSAAGGGQRQ